MCLLYVVAWRSKLPIRVVKPSKRTSPKTQVFGGLFATHDAVSPKPQGWHLGYNCWVVRMTKKEKEKRSLALCYMLHLVARWIPVKRVERVGSGVRIIRVAFLLGFKEAKYFGGLWLSCATRWFWGPNQRFGSLYQLGALTQDIGSWVMTQMGISWLIVVGALMHRGTPLWTCFNYVSISRWPRVKRKDFEKNK